MVFAAGWNVPVHDDAIYATAAFHFALTDDLAIPDLSAPTAVFEAIWGGIFSRAFGSHYGSLRIASLILLLSSVPSFYWLLRLLGTRVEIAALGSLAYAANPMLYTIANTFMTDSHAVALAVWAAALYVRGLMGGKFSSACLLAGGVASGLAFLSRQQALVVPIAIVVSLAASRSEEKRVRRAALAFFPVIAIIVAYVLAPIDAAEIRTLSISEAGQKDFHELIALGISSLKLGLAYLGLFLLPLLPMYLLALANDGKVFTGPLALATAIGVSIIGFEALVNGDLAFTHDTWWSVTGLGGIDRSVLGERPDLLPMPVLILFTLGAFTSAWFGLVIGAKRWASSSASKFVALTLIGSVFAAYAGSLAFHGVSLDRYWLPLVPFGIAAVVPALKHTRLSASGSVLILSVFAVWATIGTRDALVATEATVNLANEYTSGRLDVSQLDGGAAWMATAFGVPPIDASFSLEGVPFWVAFFNPDLDPEYAIALEPLDGYEVIDRREFSSWLHLEPTYLYLVHRDPALPFYVRPDDF
jgi:4-amino-4-deoxy-L-arabinose transferase-like glycosyltransferase